MNEEIEQKLSHIEAMVELWSATQCPRPAAIKRTVAEIREILAVAPVAQQEPEKCPTCSSMALYESRYSTCKNCQAEIVLPEQSKANKVNRNAAPVAAPAEQGERVAVCPTLDRECGEYYGGWCATCPKARTKAPAGEVVTFPTGLTRVQKAALILNDAPVAAPAEQGERKQCFHTSTVMQYAGDGTPVELCRDCGANRR
jgi:hypothetical protein